MSIKGDLIKNKSYFLAASYLIRFVVWTLYVVTNNFQMLIILQVLLGLGESLGTPSYDALVAEHLDRNKHIRDYSEWKLISNLVGAIATLVGGYVVTKYGFDYLFLVMACFAFVSFVGIFLQPKKVFK
jgi:MFS family permease